MADLDSWLTSWAKLRGECETQSLAHPNVHLCLWLDPKFPQDPLRMRICDVLHLCDHWFVANSKGNRTKSKVARQFVMGIGGLQSVGPWTWWLMHKRLADAAQGSRALNASIAAELERARDVQTTFINLAEHASDLLHNIPMGMRIRLSEDAAKATGVYLWIMVLFDIAGLPAGDPTRVVHRLFPSFVPSDCLGPETWEAHRDLRALRRNLFCESVAVIDWLRNQVCAIGAPQSEQPECYVTLLQMAGIVNRDKRTLERLAAKSLFPPAAVEGGGGKPNEWRWSDVRPTLESEYHRPLPKMFPADRFVRQ